MRPIIPLLTVALAAAPPLDAEAQTNPRAQTRHPFSSADLLAMEGVGKVRLSPDGEWIVVERQGRWDSAATYRFGPMTSHLLTRLDVSRRHDASPALTLQHPGGAAGFVSGPFSPDGRRMVVYRLTEGSWRLGVLSFDTLEVRWFDITPEYPRLGQTLAWRSDTDLVLIVREADDLPLVLRLPWGAQERIGDLWQAAAGGRSPSTVYIPSGSRRNDRERGRVSRLIRFDVVNGEEQVLARGDFFDLEISPNGRTVAALKDAEDYQIGAEIPASTGEWLRRRRLILADIETGRALEPLPDQDFISHLLTWSPNGERLISFARSPGDAFQQGRFWSIAAEGAAKALSLGAHAPWIDATWDGIPLAFAGWDDDVPVIQARSAEGARVWRRLSDVEAARSVPVDASNERLVWANGRLMILKPSGLTPFGDDHPVLAGRFSLAGGAFDGGDRRNHNPDPAWLGRQTLANSSGCVTTAEVVRLRCVAGWQGGTILAAATQNPAVITRHVSPEGAARLDFHGLQGSRRLFTINQALADVDRGEIIAIDHAGPDGAPLKSWLLLPPYSQADGSQPPVVILPYPGDVHPEAPGSLWPGSSQRHINPQVFAGAGYAVLVPSLPYERGTSDFSDLGSQLETILDAAGATGLVDTDRAALIGHSFGAHAVLLAATQTKRFRAVVASNGYADLASVAELRLYWRATTRDGVPITGAAGWAETGQGGIGRSLASDPQAYIERSPFYAADRITTPTLLIESDLDGARLASLFGVLYRLNREAALMTGFGEGHTFTSPGNIRDLYDRILDWLNRYVAPPVALQSRHPAPRPSLQSRNDQPAIARGVTH